LTPCNSASVVRMINSWVRQSLITVLRWDNVSLTSLTMLVGLLASTGLRSGEARRLDRTDVDLDNGILHIRKTKFRKDRLVPVHTTTLAALRTYARHRDAVFPVPRDAAFFLSSRGNRLSKTGLSQTFSAACKLAGLGDGKPLRPHDLRHRFAVTRLAAWHQDKADVQALLPLLATYLGHARYSDTAYYVTGTAELLGMAADRAFADVEAGGKLCLVDSRPHCLCSRA